MVEFILNNKKITTDANLAMTLVDFIRENRNLKGTKIVCREGDCGACSVLVGELSNDKTSVKYHSITSCISPLANAQGKHIVTIEGLNIDNKLNIIQQELKDNYASQCGFCTPGFVVAMVNYCLNAQAENDRHMLDAISGNICRCTGYVSIITAAKKLVEKSRAKGKKFTLEQLVKHGFIPEYFLSIHEKLVKLSQKLPQKGQNIIAGGTDLYVQQADKLLTTSALRFISLEPKQKITLKDGFCTISAMATVTDLFENKELQKYFPNLQQDLRLLSSQVIRNMATIAGNFVNASPIGDMSIFFLALDTTLNLVNEDGCHQQVKLKDFFLDYKKIALKHKQSIDSLIFQLPTKNSYFNFEKVSKRTHLDIATVNTAMHLVIENNDIIQCAIALGGVAAVPKYLRKTSRFLCQKDLSPQTIKAAIAVMQTEIAPISDVRGTAHYKRLLASNLIKAHFIKLFPEQIKFGV